MEELSAKEKIISWIFQIIAASILGTAAIGKFTGQQIGSTVFQKLGMGESGKFLIGTIEATATLLLLTPNIPHYGAILGLGTMLGAFIAHSTILGFNVKQPEGKMAMLLVLVIISCFVIMYIRRKSLPFIGETFEEEKRKKL